ncbi:hypothetical protein HDU87_002218, partial [Geranomyces variabilis]
MNISSSTVVPPLPATLTTSAPPTSTYNESPTPLVTPIFPPGVSPSTVDPVDGVFPDYAGYTLHRDTYMTGMYYDIASWDSDSAIVLCKQGGPECAAVVCLKWTKAGRTRRRCLMVKPADSGEWLTHPSPHEGYYVK